MSVSEEELFRGYRNVELPEASPSADGNAIDAASGADPQARHTAAVPAPGLHRVEIEFGDGGVWGKLICPEDGCACAEACVCGRPLGEPIKDGEGCYDCRDIDPNAERECWVKGWFDNCSVELLSGTVTVAIEASWDGEQCVAKIVEAPNV